MTAHASTRVSALMSALMSVRVSVRVSASGLDMSVRARVRTCPGAHPGPRPDMSGTESHGRVQVSLTRPHPASGDSHPDQVNASLSESGCTRPDARRTASGDRIRAWRPQTKDGRTAERAGQSRARRFAEGAEAGPINTPVNTPGVDRTLEVS